MDSSNISVNGVTFQFRFFAGAEPRGFLYGNGILAGLTVAYKHGRWKLEPYREVNSMFNEDDCEYAALILASILNEV